MRWCITFSESESHDFSCTCTNKNHLGWTKKGPGTTLAGATGWWTIHPANKVILHSFHKKSYKKLTSLLLPYQVLSQIFFHPANCQTLVSVSAIAPIVPQSYQTCPTGPVRNSCSDLCVKCTVRSLKAIICASTGWESWESLVYSYASNHLFIDAEPKLVHHFGKNYLFNWFQHLNQC